MLKKVTRREAQKALIAGNPVYLLPNRMQVNSPWAHPFRVKTPMSEEKFNRLIMKYEHACCTVDTGTLHPVLWMQMIPSMSMMTKLC